MAKKLFVSIGVSQPQDLRPLPGAISAAKRMADWARAQDYRTVIITDDGGAPVSIARLREDVTAAIDEILENDSISRIVWFFAGHGCLIPPEQRFWLLSEWRSDPSESINVNRLKRVLRYYGIDQISMIADACAEIHNNFKEVTGHQVLKQPDEADREPEYDQFFASAAGEKAFMVKGENGTDNFCIFSEIVLAALTGQDVGAFDDPNDRPLKVTSQSLAAHIKGALPLAASTHSVKMEPSLLPAFYTDRLYAQFDGRGSRPPPAVDDIFPVGPPELDFSQRMTRIEAPSDSDFMSEDAEGFAVEPSIWRLSDEVEARIDEAERERNDIIDHFVEDIGARVRTIGAGDAPESNVFIQGSEISDIIRSTSKERLAGARELQLPGTETEILVVNGHGCGYYLPVFPKLKSVLLLYENGNSSVYMTPNARLVDLNAVEILGRLEAGLLSSADSASMAAVVREGKHSDPVRGCIAAYLYDAIGDVRNIRRVASYYAHNSQPVPLDVALLCDEQIYTGEHGELLVDIPEIEASKPRTRDEAKRGFTHNAMAAAPRVPVAGNVPWMAAGWSRLADAPLSETLESWREQTTAVRGHLRDSPFTAVDPSGVALLTGVLRRRSGMVRA
ncbi:hypothetical protein C84B14_07328 [Salinisphaera sp. C84B14]|uniref:hypothetical protein n=1 Tax=Salinisphaera sp. C84B14 TaxID=1304155 RepID=UPI00333F5D25